jgi:integrase
MRQASEKVILPFMARKKGPGSVYYHRKRQEYVGQFYVQTAQGSKRKTVYAKTEAECWAKMEAGRNTAENGIWEAENPYLEDWLDSWLDQVKKRVRIRTWERYEQISRVHLKPALGEIRVKDLRRSQIQDLYDAMDLTPGPSITFILPFMRPWMPL